MLLPPGLLFTLQTKPVFASTVPSARNAEGLPVLMAGSFLIIRASNQMVERSCQNTVAPAAPPHSAPPSQPSSLALIRTQLWHLSFLSLPQLGYKLVEELSYFDIFWAGTVPDQQ